MVTDDDFTPIFKQCPFWTFFNKQRSTGVDKQIVRNSHELFLAEHKIGFGFSDGFISFGFDRVIFTGTKQEN